MTELPSRREMLLKSGGAIAGWSAACALGGSASSFVQAEDQAAQKPAPPKIKIGQIGVGHAHASKLSVYRASPDYEVVGVVEPDFRLRERAANQPAYRDLPWMTQQQLLETPGLEAVLVETRVRDSLDVAEACIAAGKHVHIDKPAGESLPQFQRILAAAEDKYLLVQLGYMYRYNPAVVMLRDLLKQGVLGTVFEVHAVMSKVVPPGERVNLAQYPGGMMFELGCHLIDLVVGILGAPTNVVPYARQTGHDGLFDNMLAVLEYPGATATVRSTALEVEGFHRRQLTVCGTGGTFHIQPLDNPQVELTLAQPWGEYPRGVSRIAIPRYSRYVADAADMAQIIREEKQDDFHYDHELAVQKTVLQASGLPVE